MFLLNLEQILSYILSLLCIKDETDLRRNYLAKAAWDYRCHFSLLAVLREKKKNSLNLEKEKVNL